MFNINRKPILYDPNSYVHLILLYNLVVNNLFSIKTKLLTGYPSS